MTLAEELARDVYATMPAAMPCNSLFAVALVNEALERAAQECEAHAEDVDTEHWRSAHKSMAKRIRARKSNTGEQP